MMRQRAAIGKGKDGGIDKYRAASEMCAYDLGRNIGISISGMERQLLSENAFGGEDVAFLRRAIFNN